MTFEQINRIITSYIEQSKENLEVENPKCDFKAAWYDLSSKAGINEFLKDSSAIANTFGLDGFIVIGYDPKTNVYHDTNFLRSKLSDTSKITDIVNKKVDRLFDVIIYDTKIEGHSISIIHIPPSIDKPHVITNYQTFDKDGKIKKEDQHRIFVRKGTSTFPASKYDIELMFYDRKNIIPEYKIQTSLRCKDVSLTVHGKENTSLHLTLPVTFENLGMRPVSIVRTFLDLFLFDDASKDEIISLECDTTITIQPGRIKNVYLNFHSSQFENREFTYVRMKATEINTNRHKLLTKSVLLALSTGKQISSDLSISKQ